MRIREVLPVREIDVCTPVYARNDRRWENKQRCGRTEWVSKVSQTRSKNNDEADNIERSSKTEDRNHAQQTFLGERKKMS